MCFGLCCSNLELCVFRCVASVAHFFIFRVIFMDSSINERLKKFRKSKGMRQEDLANKIGIKPTTYSQMERTGGITCERLLQLAAALEIDPNYLLTGENWTPPPPPEPTNSKYDFLEKTSRQELEMIKVITLLNSKQRKAVFQYAYDIFQKKIKI